MQKRTDHGKSGAGFSLLIRTHQEKWEDVFLELDKQPRKEILIPETGGFARTPRENPLCTLNRMQSNARQRSIGHWVRLGTRLRT